MDWPEAERLYRETDTPETHICRQCDVGRTALRGRAERDGWIRPAPVRRGPPGKSPPAATGGAAFESAEQYLEAVVCGTTPPDAARVSAARVLMAYQQARKRSPMAPERTPVQQAKHEAHVEEKTLLDDWAKKAAEVRARLASERKRNL